MKSLLELINKIKIFRNKFLYTYGLEFPAVTHCTLKCFGCSQNSPYMKKHFADVALFENSLRVLGKYLRPNKITILGGEPLLHPEISSIVRIARQSGMFKEVCVTTNGSNIISMNHEFWDNIDLLTISKYPCNAEFIDLSLSKIKEKCLLYGVRLEIKDIDSFNYISLSEENKNRDLVKEIYNKCIYKYFCHTLSDGKIFRCSPVVNFMEYQLKNASNNLNESVDFLDIKDSINFRKRLFEYLDSKDPMDGCSFCLGSSGKSFKHRQLSMVELEKPTKLTISELNYDNYR